jgi:hypothetical protein
LVGASREKVNRQLRQWEQQGALVHEHCYVHILKPNSLVTDESQAYPQANGDRHLISASRVAAAGLRVGQRCICLVPASRCSLMAHLNTSR